MSELALVLLLGLLACLRYAGRARRRARLGLSLLLAIVALALLAALAIRFVPLPENLFQPQFVQLEIVDRNGRSLRSARADGAPFNRQVAYGQIPERLANATIAAEDHRFRQHPGVDWRGTLRAGVQFIIHLRVISGGSTITQQLIKMAEPRPRTFRTKFIEALQALRLEQVWDKQRILAEYLNRLEYGNFNTGCAAAAQFYFGKPLADLSVAECALLAGLPQAPSRLNPLTHLDRAQKRQQWVLTQMLHAGYLTADEFDRARQQPLHFVKPARAFEAPHFVDLLLQQISRSGTGKRSLLDAREPKAMRSFLQLLGGEGELPATLRTTLDLDLNRFAETVVRRHLSKLGARQAHNGAAVVIENKTGNVLALVGSENYFAPGSGQVNGAWSPRSAGSAIKPFTYLLAFERGATPATIVADVPSDFSTATGLFSPVNYNRHCYGPVRYHLALANSLNIPAVKVLASIGGPLPLQRLLQAAGLTTLTRAAEEYGLGLTIGNAETRLLELANAYACLARLGEYRPFRLLAETAPARATNLSDSGTAFLIADILADNDARTLAFGAETPLRFDFPVACKTGTSSDFRDNWAFGYTPEFTVGVWIGNFDGAPMREVSGVTGAGPILHDLVEHLHATFGTTWYATPQNIVECLVHPLTGHRLTASRPHTGVKEKFLADRLPAAETEADYAAPRLDSQIVRLGPEYRDWFEGSDNWLGQQAVCSVSSDASLRIKFPPPGTTLYLDPDLPGEGGRMRLQADGSDSVEWQSETLKLDRQGSRQFATLVPGRHRLIAFDHANSAHAETWIEVIRR